MNIGTNDKNFIQNLISFSIVTMAILLIILLLVIIYWMKYSNNAYTTSNICMNWFGYTNNYQSMSTNSSYDFDDFDSSIHQLPWQININKGNRENNTVNMEMVNLPDSNNNNLNNINTNNMYVAPTLSDNNNNNNVLEKSHTKQSISISSTSSNYKNNSKKKYSVINNNEDIDDNEDFELHL